MKPDEMPKPPEGVTQVPEDMPPLPNDLLKVPKEGRIKKLLPKVILIVVLLVALGALGYFYLQNQLLKNQIAQLEVTPTPSSTPIPIPEQKTEEEIILDKAEVLFKNLYPNDIVTISEKDLQIDGDWAFGKASPPRDLVLYIAHRDEGEWTVVTEKDALYKTWFQQLPNTLVSQETKDFYKNQ
jgi:hypothetical protein